MSGRALVSSRGDGNWSTGNTLTAASTNVYFPPGTGTNAPDSTQDLTNNINYAGWENKSNWIAQAKVTSGAGSNATIAIYVTRPTGVEELIQTSSTITFGAAADSVTIGGVGDELVVGPVSFFRFHCSAITNSPTVSCYVIGWNEGDIIS
jgi:hypothetical protein